MSGMRILHLEWGFNEISDITRNWVWKWGVLRLGHGHRGLRYSESHFMQHLEFTKTVCVTQKHLQNEVEVVSGLSRSTCGLCAGCLQIALPSAVGDPNVVKLSSWCPVFSLTLLGCPTKPLLTPMPAQHWSLQEGAEGREASYLSCSHKYERWGFQTPKGSWRNILFLSEEFPSVRYKVSFCSGHYPVRALNTLLLKTFVPVLWS